MLSAIAPFAISYIQSRTITSSSGWPGGVTFKWLHAVASVLQRFAHGVTKFARLRWALGEDDDLGLKIRIPTGHQGTLTCCHCSAVTCTYPFGMQFFPVCECCIAKAGLSCWTLHSFESLGMLPDHHGYSLAKVAPWSQSPKCGSQRPHIDHEGQETEYSKWPPCIACKSGDNCFGHWARWCPVPLVVSGVLLNDMSGASLSQLAERGNKELLVTTHVAQRLQ